jgi:hypothetical protein
MKPLFFLVVAGMVLLSPAPGAGGANRLPPPDAAAVWQYITKTSPFTGWGSWPDYQGLQRARSPHGPFNRVYVNRIGLGSAKPPVGHGTMEVKAVQNKDGKIKGVVVQYKVKGYNPAAGDWFWAKYSPGGRVAAAGKLKGCIRCHSVLADNDYIMVHHFR